MKRLLMGAVLLACDQTSPPSATCPDGVLVAVSDYTSSLEGVLPLDGSPPVLLKGDALGSDPALAMSAGRRFFIERDKAENVYELDSCGIARATYATRASTAVVDPQDVAVASDGSLWIARLFASSALVIGAARSEIDLSSADADGIPNMSAVRIAQTAHGEKAFFALERLDDHDPNLALKQPSAMAVIDVATHALDQVVVLAGRNPFGLMPQVGPLLWMAAIGRFDADHETDAGIAFFSTDTLTSTLLIPESVIGGSVGTVAIDGSCGAAIAFDAVPNVNHTFLVAFDVQGNVVQSAAFGPTTGFDLAGLLWVDGTLLVGDRRPTSAGYLVHTFTRDGACALKQGPDLAGLALPPVAFSLN
jgi:hypothetical protein